MGDKQNSLRKFLSSRAIERCAVEVTTKNRRNLLAFSVLGVVTMSFAIVFAWLMRDVFTFSSEFVAMWVYFLIMFLVNKSAKDRVRHITAAFYLWMIPLMLIGIAMGTFADPDEPSITIMVFLCVLPIFILDKPWRIALFIFTNAAVYTLCCFMAKTRELFMADMIDLVLFTVLGVGVNFLTLRDRIDNVEYAMQMRLAAQTDALTELNNRGAGEAKIRLLMDQGMSGMLLLIDVDNFKGINDKYGHANGDQVLKATASCLKQAFCDHDVIIRFGGDEFMIFAQSLKNNKDGTKCIERMLKSIRRLSIAGMADHHFSISVGASLFDPKSGKDFEMIYRESDEALYQAKRNGKDALFFFSEAQAAGDSAAAPSRT